MSAGVVVLAAATAYLVYWFTNLPIPQAFKNPWKLRLLFAVLKIMRTVDDIKVWFGADPAHIIVGIRNLKWLRPKICDSSTIEKEDLVLGGVKVRIYTPKKLPATKNPGIVYLHGGGWCVGSIDSTDALCQQVAATMECVVASVEYRLAPEHPYPAPIDDCFAATKDFIQQTERFGVDPQRIALLGDSAGGNLVAATALRMRDAAIKPMPKLQVLLYPCLQAHDFKTPSYQANEEDPLLPKYRMTLFWLLYATGKSKYLNQLLNNNHTSQEVKEKTSDHQLRHELITSNYPAQNYTKQFLKFGDEDLWKKLEPILTDPYFAPLMGDNLTDLPEALVYTMEQDVLRDDGIWYVKALQKAGVMVAHRHFFQGFHGLSAIMLNLTDTDESRKIIFDDIKARL